MRVIDEATINGGHEAVRRFNMEYQDRHDDGRRVKAIVVTVYCDAVSMDARMSDGTLYPLYYSQGDEAHQDQDDIDRMGTAHWVCAMYGATEYFVD